MEMLIRSMKSVKRHISLSVKGQIICRFSGLPSVKGQIEAFRNLAYTRQDKTLAITAFSAMQRDNGLFTRQGLIAFTGRYVCIAHQKVLRIIFSR